MTAQKEHDLSRRTLLRKGATAGGAVLLGGAAVLATTSAPADAVTDRNFRWCRRCQGMWFIAGGNKGHCPVHHWWDHSHYQDGSGIYHFIDVMAPAATDDFFGQIVLRWCLTCKAAYFWQHPSSGLYPDRVCPNNSAGHTPAAAKYRVEMEQLPPLSGFPKQSGWRRCQDCQVLFFIGNGRENTRCSANPVTGVHTPAHIHMPAGWEEERYLARF